MTQNLKDKLSDILVYCFIILIAVPFISVPVSMFLLIVLELFRVFFCHGLIMGQLVNDSFFLDGETLLTTWRIFTFCMMGVATYIFFKKK